MKPSGHSTTTNPVEQLKLLRSFVSSDVDPSGHPHHSSTGSTYTESELFKCLKYSGYNVERAAELLMTGQYRTIMKRLQRNSHPPSHRPLQTTTANSTASTTTTTKMARSGTSSSNKSAFFHSTTTSPIKIKQKKHSPLPTSTRTATATATIKQSQRKPPPAALPPPRVSMTPTIESSYSYGTNLRTKKTNHRDGDNDVDVISILDDEYSNPTYTSSATPMVESTKISPPLSMSKISADGPYLLCQRWISNATITSRHGTGRTVVRYREPFMVDFTQTGYSLMKFRTTASSSSSRAVVEGRLPENIARLLIPFFRYPQQSQSDDASSLSTIISVTLESMMEETNVIVGSTIPIQIKIYIHDLHRFFHIISPEATPDGNGTTSSTHYFQRQRSKITNGSRKVKKYHTLPLNEAAFLLFQWAQYGDVPVSDDSLRQTGIGSTNSTENDTTKPASSTEAKCPMDCAESDDDDDDDDTGDDEDDENFAEIDDEELDKEDIESTEISNRKSMEIISSSASSVSLWTDSLPDDIADPVIFQQYNISLRPYQKQALYFMLQRENIGMTREQLDDQLQILNELLDQQQSDKNHLPSSYRNQHKLLTNGSADIECDCGPVVLTDRGQQSSQTLCGETNTIGHPLWQRRYLASSDMKQSITVFVNELLGIVTHVSPQAPKHCSGGILADAMGLGKTVMLLALMLKSKEGRSERQERRNVASPSATLVVAKLSLLPQWEAELKTKTNLTYKIYYGATSGKPTKITDFLYNVVRQLFLDSS